MEIVEIKCDGCGTMRKWRGYECLTFCDCLADKPEDESNLLDAQVIVKLADIYSAMAYLFNGGEFPDWLNKQGIPLGAMKEYEEAKNYFDENIKSKFSE